MATMKAISGNVIKKDSGAVLFGGNVSSTGPVVSQSLRQADSLKNVTSSVAILGDDVELGNELFGKERNDAYNVRDITPPSGYGTNGEPDYGDGAGAINTVWAADQYNAMSYLPAGKPSGTLL
jgi:hypothetical protein